MRITAFHVLAPGAVASLSLAIRLDGLDGSVKDGSGGRVSGGDLPRLGGGRSLLLLALIACGDKPPAEIVAPTNGSTAVVPVATPDAVVVTPSRIALRASGKPPIKTTKPIARDQLTKLSALELPGLTRTIRKLDDAFLDVGYQLAEPPIRVGVTAQPCLRCLPMQIDRWRAETDALRVTIPPDLRERGDTAFELGVTAIGGAQAIATHQVAFGAGDTPTYDHAVAVYWNDGVNELRVIAAFAGTASSRDALTRSVTREELEQLAIAVLDHHAQAW